jgi:molybdate/tungstate transport system substrate-binding protein
MARRSKPLSLPYQGLSSRLPIFYAGSLDATFARVNAEFKKPHPNVEIVAEPAGSVTAIRKITEQKMECGVVASADYKLIFQLMFPNYADWYIIFASEQIVLCYTEKSKYQNQINADNWYEILQKEDVKFGRHDPDQDPGGYRTLMVWQLAEKYYGIPGLYQKLLSAKGNIIMSRNMKPADLDYTFGYKAPALQNHLKYVELPEEISLSSKRLENYYAQAKVELKGSKIGETITVTGEPILFGLTVPKNFPNQKLALSWVDFLLGNNGVAIMEAMGMNIIKPGITNDIDKVPGALKRKVKQELC